MYGSNETALNAKNLVEGYCWFTTDDGKFYVDTKNSSGVLSRIVLNAGKADQLATARTFRIADNDATNKGPTTSFNGSANVIINLPSTIKASLSGNASSASSLQAPQALTTDELIDNFLAANTFQVAIWNNASSLGVTNGTIISGGWNNTTFGWQLAIDDDPTYYMALRQKSTTWGAWKRIPMGDGTGASGTWGISITGNASTASQLGAYSAAGEYTKNTLAYFNTSVSHSGTAQKGVNDGPTTTNTWWHFLRFTHSNGAGYYTDLAVPFNANSLYYKRIANGSVQNASTNAGWVQVLDALNYTTYCAPASHSHSYLPLSGGTLTGLLTISTNNRYVVLGCQNEGYAHYSTNADTGHWFNKPVSVQGDIYCGSDYSTKVLTVNGGDITSGFTKPHKGMSWIGVSHGQGAIARITTAPTDGSASCCWAVKTLNGSWGCGNLSNTDNLYFVYGTTANFTAGTNTATYSIYMSSSGVLYGAAWNDYAEFRQGQQEYKPGTCVIEVGNDTLVQSTERLQGGALIVSDTFGFAIGETDEAKTPIATSGRVLAYTFEPRESYSAGDPVCSGPNGTVSKMTKQEVMMYPYKMIGTVSAIPDYEEWGTGKVKVDGRIWIQIR